MKVLIIGGNGFLGSHIADRLAGAGASLRILDVAPDRFRAPLPGAEYVQGSFLDPLVLDAALEGVEVVCHLASTTVPSTAAADPMRDVKENLLGSLAILKAMRSRKIRRLVFVSSGGTVYGVPETVPIPESHPLRPRTSYGIIKVAIESYIEDAFRAGDIEPLIFRISNPYGPRQSLAGVQGVIASFLGRIHSRRPIEIWGDGSVIRDFLFVGDVAELFERALRSDRCGTYNVGSGKGLSLKEIISAIRSATGLDFAVRYQEGRTFDIPKNVLAVEKVKAEFGWEVQTPLDKGLAETWAWIQSLIE